MELAQVFASNIQIGQFKRVIPQYEWCEKRFEEERNYFLWWLLQSDKGGKYKFLDQVSAWETYERIHEPIELEEDEEFTPSWLEEIENAINNAVRSGNYNEYRGQL
jgi:hypothetical protein